MLIASWRLPLRFDPERLLADLALIEPDEWALHFNTGAYDGDWGGVALRAPIGGVNPLYPDAQATFADTPLLARCSYLAEVLAAFECELESARLLRLRAGSIIREHRDYKLGLEDGTLRVHIPITTNPGVRFFLQGKEVPMSLGEAWYLNVNLPHRVENTGSTDRVHLVIDGVVNDWVRGLIAAGEGIEVQGAAALAPAPPFAAPAHAADADDAVVTQLIAFLGEIGLAVREAPIEGPSFLPGVAIAAGELVVDRAQLRYPGDLLHEAGHLAVAEPGRRTTLSGDAGGDPAEEMMALAWSYAAAVQLGLDPAIVFHDSGYKGGAATLREAFQSGSYIGLPMLQWVGMAVDAVQAQAHGLPAFPAMLHWLRQRPEPSAAHTGAAGS